MTDKQKVINRLVKLGTNPIDAIKYTEENWDYISKQYTGIAKMAEAVMYL